MREVKIGFKALRHDPFIFTSTSFHSPIYLSSRSIAQRGDKSRRTATSSSRKTTLLRSGKSCLNKLNRQRVTISQQIWFLNQQKINTNMKQSLYKNYSAMLKTQASKQNLANLTKYNRWFDFTLQSSLYCLECQNLNLHGSIHTLYLSFHDHSSFHDFNYLATLTKISEWRQNLFTSGR